MKTVIKKLSLILAVLLAVFLVIPFTVEAANRSNRSEKSKGVKKITVMIMLDGERDGFVESDWENAFGGYLTYTDDMEPAVVAIIPESAVKGLLHNPYILDIIEDETLVVPSSSDDDEFDEKEEPEVEEPEVEDED